jgi:RNA polymerase sigma-70 factor (ECF subfamily)
MEEPMADGPEPSCPAEWLNTDRHAVRQAMRALSPDQRRLVELAFYSGFSHSELAERLNLPLGTVKTRIRVAMLKLREALTRAGNAAMGSGHGA